MGRSTSGSRHRSSGWARATLRAGRSAGGTWEVDESYREARLTVGASPGVGWPIEGLGVRPAHCELYWDGHSLWVNDPAGLDDVYLDGMPVQDWTQVEGPAALTFGEAALDVETASVERRPLRTNPALARPVTVPSSPVEDAPASVLDALVMLDSVESGDMTRIDVRADDFISVPELRTEEGDRAEDGDGGESSSLDELPRDGSTVHPSATLPSEDVPLERDLRPRLGGGFASMEPAQSFDAATRMVEVGGAAPPALPPRGADVAAPLRAVTFRAPPAVDRERISSLRPSDPTADARPIPVARRQSLPPRTWAMVGVTVLAAVGALLWEPAPQPGEPSESAPSAAVEGPVGPPARRAKEAPVDLATMAAMSPEAPVGAPSGGGGTLQRVAIEHFAAGRLGNALTAYRALATLHPEQDAFGTMARILERQLARACPPGDETCR